MEAARCDCIALAEAGAKPQKAVSENKLWKLNPKMKRYRIKVICEHRNFSALLNQLIRQPAANG